MNNDFPQIKRDLIAAVNEIKTHIEGESTQREEVRILLGKVSIILFGDPTAYPPIVGRIAEFDNRLKALEAVEANRIKIKNDTIGLAVGSATIAIGGAIIWIGAAIKAAFIKVH